MQGFVLYCLCDVVYDGRAYSTLERGNYLIIYKPDGSLLIHGSSKSTPRNYQSVGSKVDLQLERESEFGQHGTLVSQNNNETIENSNYYNYNGVVEKSKKEEILKLKK